MQKRLLEQNYLISLRYGKKILIAIAVLTVIMALFIPRLKISTSRSDLIPADHPEQARYLKFVKEFGAADNLIVILEGDTEVLKSMADQFASELKKETKWVESIFYRIDTDIIMKHAPLFVPLEKLQQGTAAIREQHGMLNSLKGMNNLHALLKAMQSAMNSSGFKYNKDTANYYLNSINTFFEEWNQWIKDPTHNSIDILDKLFLPPGGKAAEDFIKSDGLLFSRDYKMLLLMVQPKNYNDDVSYLEPFVRDMRKACDRVLARYPNIQGQIKVVFTGMPMHVLTETETIYSDVGRAGMISIFLVAIILFFGFGSLKKMIIGVVPLLCGMVITLGVISLTVGRLNLISSAFLAVLFGIGIDFGIYLIRRTEEELGNGFKNEEAVHKAVVLTGKGIITGGFTTGLAFLSITFSEFVGYSELGMVAGMGVFIVLFVTVIMMPCLLLLFKIEPRRDDTEPSVPAIISERKGRTLWAILIPSIIFVLFSIYATFHIKMDYNVLKLLPRNMESTIYNQKMEENSNYKSSIAFITTKDYNQLNEFSERIKKLPTVSSANSYADLIPDKQEEKIAVIKKYKPYLYNLNIPYYPSKASAGEYAALLEDIGESFGNYQEKAFSGGQTEIVENLEKVIINIEELIESFSGENSSFALTRTRFFEKELYADVAKVTQLIKDWLNVKPFSEKDMSKEMAAHFKSKEGTYVIYITPNGSIWDLKFLDKFVADIQSVSQTATGFPVTHRVYVRLAARAIIQAVVISLFIVIILLYIDFRKINAVILSLVPLVVGILLMQSCLYFAGISYNVANVAGLPLLLGLGVVYGVHIVHRWLENPRITAFSASHTTGRGVSFAAFTTISGLFSIVFARHNGVSSFGVILLIGITLCLLTALFLLPTIIDLIYLRKKKEEKHDKK